MQPFSWKRPKNPTPIDRNGFHDYTKSFRVNFPSDPIFTESRLTRHRTRFQWTWSCETGNGRLDFAQCNGPEIENDRFEHSAFPCPRPQGSKGKDPFPAVSTSEPPKSKLLEPVASKPSPTGFAKSRKHASQRSENDMQAGFARLRKFEVLSRNIRMERTNTRVPPKAKKRKERKTRTRFRKWSEHRKTPGNSEWTAR